MMASPDDREGPRRLVKATYAHKKGRISKTSGLLNINASSPLQILDRAHAATLVPVSEMTRRMLKRSRQSQIPVPQNQQQQHEQPKRKRSKAGNSTDATQSYSMALNDVRPKSRNLKENSSPAFGKSISSSRTLGTSPSNHHSPLRGNSRKSTKGRLSQLALATKPIPVSSITNSQHENTKNHSSSGTSLLNQESTAIPSKVKMSKKKISLADLANHIASKPSTPVLTLANFSPTVVSTPLPNLNVSFVAKHFGVPELSENSNAIPAISPAHKRQDSNLDIPKLRKTIHIPSNSIFSDSVDFTLVSSRTYDPSSSNNEAQLVTDSDSLFEPRTPRKKQLVSLKEVVFGPGRSSSIIAAPSCPQTQTQTSITDNGDTALVKEHNPRPRPKPKPVYLGSATPAPAPIPIPGTLLKPTSTTSRHSNVRTKPTTIAVPVPEHLMSNKTSTSEHISDLQDPDSESDDELLLKAPGWIDEDLEYLGPPNQMFNNYALPAQGEDESDDELLLLPGRKLGYE